MAMDSVAQSTRARGTAGSILMACVSTIAVVAIVLPWWTMDVLRNEAQEAEAAPEDAMMTAHVSLWSSEVALLPANRVVNNEFDGSDHCQHARGDRKANCRNIWAVRVLALLAPLFGLTSSSLFFAARRHARFVLLGRGALFAFACLALSIAADGAARSIHLGGRGRLTGAGFILHVFGQALTGVISLGIVALALRRQCWARLGAQLGCGDWPAEEPAALPGAGAGAGAAGSGPMLLGAGLGAARGGGGKKQPPPADAPEPAAQVVGHLDGSQAASAPTLLAAPPKDMRDDDGDKRPRRSGRTTFEFRGDELVAVPAVRHPDCGAPAAA